MLNIMKRLVYEEKGQGMAEYGLILALVALVVAGALTVMQGGLSGIFNAINTALGGATGS